MARAESSDRARETLALSLPLVGLTSSVAGFMATVPDMAQRAAPQEYLVYAGRVLALAVLYFALGRVGPALTPMSGFATLVWSASGAALAALVLNGVGLWPGIALGALATEIAQGLPPLAALGITAGITLEAVAGTLALRCIPDFHASLDRLKDVLGFSVLAGMMSPVIGATVGTICLALGQSEPIPVARTWLTWWSGDLIGILLIAPLILTWARGPRPIARPGDTARTTLLGAFLLGSSALLFSASPGAPWIHVVRPYVLFLPLLWMALCRGVRGAATGMLLLAIPALWGTYTGHGIFTHADLIERLGCKSLVALESSGKLECTHLKLHPCP